MRIKAQIAMVINLDKCIGCHTCSITCKNTWTNRPGAEYMWFNNVETKPGIGYPKEWENQHKYKGGWEVKNGKLRLKAGNQIKKMINIFHNPNLPTIDEYYEPWTYDYDNLTKSKERIDQPVARSKSLITSDYMDINWGPNWEDDLAGAHETGKLDQNIKGIEERIKFEFEQTFMMYLPRLCEHCLNPACVASCPSGAIYKRDEDGIVLVDQETCRSWRFCISGCPYKKVYFNWQTHKAEKCILCYPRIENGLPTVCSETCSGRIRYLGVILYDADKVKEYASIENDEKLYETQLKIFLDPNDEETIKHALKDDISEDWIIAAQNSPIYKLIVKHKLALPLHPEFKTLPMVWYIPPLSPIINTLDSGNQLDSSFLNIEDMRIPIEYLANLLTAGNIEAVKNVLKRLTSIRYYMRAKNIGKNFDKNLLDSIELDDKSIEEMYRLLAIAKYEDRYVIPTVHKEKFIDLQIEQGTAGYKI